jgi:hypothetical protein
MDWSSTDWKSAALAIVPELAGEIAKAETPYLLWIDLYQAFREAYDPPGNDALIGQIYRYAKWCLDQPRAERYEDDIRTCVCLCFYQNVPLLRPARDELGKWLATEDFSALKFVLRFHCDDDDAFERIAAQFRPE